MSARLSVAAIVLAAGRSTRMAPRNKLLETVDGEAMVRHASLKALRSGTAPVIVVTGHQADRVSEALRGLDVRLIYNPGYADGLSTSLRAGLAALPVDCGGALICLADMPWVEENVLRALIAAFIASGPHSICVPVNDGRRGNPVLWGKAHFADMMALAGDEGAKSLMGRHQDRIVEVEVATDSIFADADQASDLARSN